MTLRLPADGGPLPLHRGAAVHVLDDQAIQELAEHIGRASRVTILTGAGVSAASGVPTFRGAQGLWRGVRAEDLATPDAFARNPALVWEWYAGRREAVGRCDPNEAHHVIARWSEREGCRVVTQNVDDLHLRAGTRALIRLHGSLWELLCTKRCAYGRWRNEDVPFLEMPPRCPGCNAVARPGVVWFGESLDPRHVRAAEDAAARCDVFITVGTSSIVYPAAGLVHHARGHHAYTVEVNPEATPSTGVVDLALRGPAETVLPAVEARLRTLC
jgi:NAD-dependent deacetylase